MLYFNTNVVATLVGQHDETLVDEVEAGILVVRGAETALAVTWDVEDPGTGPPSRSGT